ncbi:MAG: hypothetical protein OXG44_13205 [Gammaproteobacteria bacterium]|nr:hypothetical protein [Gammaproteobacteria bacterium]
MATPERTLSRVAQRLGAGEMTSTHAGKVLLATTETIRPETR